MSLQFCFSYFFFVNIEYYKVLKIHNLGKGALMA